MREEYFEWLCEIVSKGYIIGYCAYDNLFRKLFETEFTYTIPNDENRAADGEYLRYRFASDYGYLDTYELYLDGPCSILELMVALAIRCEESIMDDPLVGDRTGYWFWRMISTLGLSQMTDDEYNPDEVEFVINRFLNREYSRDGNGGLFRIRGLAEDMREFEIWHQLCWYLDTIC